MKWKGHNMSKQIFDLKYRDEVTKYLKQKGCITNPFIIEDISTGNMNYVYRAKEVKTGKTYVLKYAAKHTRISEDILVSTQRISIEARVLMEFNQYVPQYVPYVYQYDDKNNCIIMKDYSEYCILRDKLNHCEIIPDFADNITSYLIKGIIPTLNLDTNEELKGSDIQKINNPLCDTTKTYVFSEPFMKHGNTNDIFELSKEFVDHEVYQDHELFNQIEKLKRQFINKKQALIHGDLHTGSIFVKESSIIIFDYEFAFYGPVGFDIGNLLAHLIFSWLHAKELGQKKEFLDWVENTIGQIIDKFKKKFVSQFIENYNKDGHYSSEYISTYVDDIIHDTASFAGVELIRRVIGIAHVSDIVLIDNPKKRAEAEQTAIKLAKLFVMNNQQFHSGTDFTNKIIEYY